jgi:hypothetical protein
MNPKYSSENFRTNKPGIHFSNGEYHTNRDIDTDRSKTDSPQKGILFLNINIAAIPWRLSKGSCVL